jgi:hypothetical protein
MKKAKAGIATETFVSGAACDATLLPPHFETWFSSFQGFWSSKISFLFRGLRLYLFPGCRNAVHAWQEAERVQCMLLVPTWQTPMSVHIVRWVLDLSTRQRPVQVHRVWRSRHLRSGTTCECVPCSAAARAQKQTRITARNENRCDSPRPQPCVLSSRSPSTAVTTHRRSLCSVTALSLSHR